MNTEQAAEAVNEICRRIGASAEYIVPQFSKMKAADSFIFALICGALSAALISAFTIGLKKLIGKPAAIPLALAMGM